MDSTSEAPGDAEAEQTQPLSKSAQKKLAKAARFASFKQERRAREKEVRKEKKRVIAEKRAAGELDEDEEREEEEKRRSRKRQKGEKKRIFGARVAVDLGFDDKMSEKEVTSLCSQLAYTYSVNRRSSTPFSSILFTSLNGRTLTRLESLNDASYKRWSNTEWWSEGYEKLWEVGEGANEESTKREELPEREEDETGAGGDEGAEDGKAPPEQTFSKAAKESVVYLTADSSDELFELKEDETYIIGGICDHNRYKNLCLDKANASPIRTARLPIGTYLSHLPTRKVLTVNQVFEIMLKWVETRNWEEALQAVVPKRKFQSKGNSKDHGAAGAAMGEDETGLAGDDDEEGLVVPESALDALTDTA